MKIADIKKKLNKDLQKLKTKKGYLMAGFPRFKRLYGRDSVISAWQLLEHDPSVAKATILELAKYQGKKRRWLNEEEPGKILHEVPGAWPDLRIFPNWLRSRRFPYYGSIDSTPLWLILVAFYYKKTSDHELISQIKGNIELALEWMVKYGDKDGDGLLEYRRRNILGGLKHQGWKDGMAFSAAVQIFSPVALIEVQGYAYCAFRLWGELEEETKIKTKYNLQEKAKHLRQKVVDSFWMDDEQYFAFALDKNKKQNRMVTSNPGHLLFSGILDQNKAELVVKRLFSPDMLTKYGIRTHSTKGALFSESSYHRGSIWPHDNWIIHQGLLSYNMQEEAKALRQMMWAAYEEMQGTYELYGVKLDGEFFVPKKSGAPFAWSAGAFISILKYEQNN